MAESLSIDEWQERSVCWGGRPVNAGSMSKLRLVLDTATQVFRAEKVHESCGNIWPVFANAEAEALERLENIDGVPKLIARVFNRRARIAVIVMECCVGQKLWELAAGPLECGRVTNIIEQLLVILDGAHREGVVHRDLNNTNIILGENDELSLVDFGVAKVDGMPYPKSDHFFGTANTSAPEVWIKNGKVDNRSDLYAAGILYYELLAGREANKITEPAEDGMAYTECDMLAIQSHVDESRRFFHFNEYPVAIEGVPKPIMDFVFWLIKKNPDDRPESAAVALAELRKIMVRSV